MKRLLFVFALLLGGVVSAQPIPRPGGGNTFSKTIVSNVSASGMGLILTNVGAKICFNGASCTDYLRDDGAGQLQFGAALTSPMASGSAAMKLNGGAYICFNQDYVTPCLGSRVGEDGFGGMNIGARFGVTIDPGSLTAPINLQEGPVIIGNAENSNLKISPNNAGTPILIITQGTNVGVNITPNGTGAFSLNSAFDPVPAVHGSQTTASQSIEYGTKALTGGTGTVTFATAFSVAPVCVCDDSSAVTSAQCATSGSVLTITGTGTDSVRYICIGAK